MIVAINGLFAKTGGGVTYLRNLLRSLLEASVEDEYVVFVAPERRSEVIVVAHSRMKVVEVSLPGRLARLSYEQVILPLRLRSCRANVLYAPAEIAPILAPCPVVLGLQNANVYQTRTVNRALPDRVRNALLFLLAWLSVRRARALIFLSNASRLEISAALQSDPERGVVIYHGIDPIFRNKIGADSLEVGRLEEGPILCVSAIGPHKNVKCLIEAYINLDEKLRSRHELLIAGPIIDRSYHKRLTKMLTEADIDPEAVFLREVPFEELPSLYKAAAVLVFPSILETFGLPLLEAMASGLPVLAANVSCIPEIVGGAAIPFDPCDPCELTAKVSALLVDPVLWDDLVRRGYERAAEFSWGKAAEKTLEVLRRAVLSGTRVGAKG